MILVMSGGMVMAVMIKVARKDAVEVVVVVVAEQLLVVFIFGALVVVIKFSVQVIRIPLSHKKYMRNELSYIGNGYQKQRMLVENITDSFEGIFIKQAIFNMKVNY